MRIREASEQSGVSASTIRYYDQLGLLGAVKRTSSGYRVFDDRDVRLLGFLRRARDLGFTLEECSELIELVVTSDRQSPDNIRRTRELALRRLEEVDQQMQDLARRRELIELHVKSLDALAEDCPVTKDL
jgi:MerR family copper efflux transcriptional regulator